MVIRYEPSVIEHKPYKLKKHHKHVLYTDKPEPNTRVSVPPSMGAGCICDICNEYRDDMTHAHAATHGFESRDAMFIAGKFRYLNKIKQQSNIRRLGVCV